MKHWFVFFLALASVGSVKGQQTITLSNGNIGEAILSWPLHSQFFKDMANRKLLSFLLCMFAMVSTAQTYMPVLSEGKVWRYATVNRYERTDTTGYYNVTVSGDTIVNHFVCKKILVQNENGLYPCHTFVAYEDGGKVYKVKDNVFTLLFDIGLQKGDNIENLALVVAESETVINGIRRRIIVVDSMVDHFGEEYYYLIIEGVGVSKDEFIPNFNLGNNDEFCTLVSCTDKGTIIISEESLRNIETGIKSPTFTNRKDDAYYDLNGIKILIPQKGYLYICNGKKIVFR